MRKLFLLALAGFSFGTVAQPTAWHTLDPLPNPYGWHNTPVTVTLYASEGSQICYRLDGGPTLCQTPSAALVLSCEGLHTLEYWARDDTGEGPRFRVTVRIDRTPPAIHVQVPSQDARYLLRQSVRADWWAFDRLSGLETVEASARNGDPLDTSTPGPQTFRVWAKDRAGNTAHVEVDYLVICAIETVLPSGFYLDRLLPPEERVQAGRFPLQARYTAGETITLAFRLRDFFGQAGPWTRPNLLVTQVQPDPEFGEKHTIWAWLLIPYAPEAGVYKLVYDTRERAPGVYDLWLSFGDGQSERIRIELLATRP
ncbi:MAG: hypothetical protein NZ651_05070 [Candidatus Bipolaricaulota bacterium]|nr:hypothetical protein [Candidatus Bipolaricaulota bacterium]MDW8127125.1 hypothetical protein [Candidatus Bipolaricaulota bacterium]